MGNGNLHLTENRLNRYEMWCAVDNYNHMFHISAKGFLDLNFNQAVIDKRSNFHEMHKISHIHKNRNFLRGETVYVNFLVTVSCSLNISVVYFC